MDPAAITAASIEAAQITGKAVREGAITAERITRGVPPDPPEASPVS